MSRNNKKNWVVVARNKFGKTVFAFNSISNAI